MPRTKGTNKINKNNSVRKPLKNQTSAQLTGTLACNHNLKKEMGVSDAQIQTMFVDIPRRFLEGSGLRLLAGIGIFLLQESTEPIDFR